jgi:hypothetical protein
MTVGLIFLIGRRLSGTGAGLWAAALAAISPLLITYSLEAKMYAWLTWLTCLSWWNLLAFRDGVRPWRAAVQTSLLAALAYSQPLGLFMGVALGLGALLDRPRSRLTMRAWLAIHLAAAVLVLPWIGHYLDHPPEFLSDRPTLKLLLGMPIGFTGGDSRILVLLVSAILVGLAPFDIRGLTRGPRVAGAGPILVWLILPPLMLFAYSLLKYPIFGPSRYNVYVAPAYLILIGAGIARTNRLVQFATFFYLLPGLASFALIEDANAINHGRKADWRSAARRLDESFPGVPVVVIAPSPGPNYEVEVARFYLGDRRVVIPMPGRELDDVRPLLGPHPGLVIFSASTKNGTPVGDVPAELIVDSRFVRHWNYRGLRLFETRLGPSP